MVNGNLVLGFEHAHLIVSPDLYYYATGADNLPLFNRSDELLIVSQE